MFPCDASVRKGDELGWFEHGSTIIVLAPDHFEFATMSRKARASAPAKPLLRKPRPRSRFCGRLSLYGREIRNREAGREMARTPVLAAGGIVLRQAETPLVAVVRLRKRNEWVLPKGKLDDGETPRDAAEREVMEETGHDVSVHEFLGTLVYESRGGSKVVHYWRMEARGDAVHELMRDVRAVDWLPLVDAVDRLSRGYERAFLENVGPIALAAAAHAAPARKARAKPPAPAKRRTPRPGVSAPPAAAPMLAPPQSETRAASCAG